MQAHLWSGRREASRARPPGPATTSGHASGAVACSGAGTKPVAMAAMVTTNEPMKST